MKKMLALLALVVALGFGSSADAAHRGKNKSKSGSKSSKSGSKSMSFGGYAAIRDAFNEALEDENGADEAAKQIAAMSQSKAKRDDGTVGRMQKRFDEVFGAGAGDKGKEAEAEEAGAAASLIGDREGIIEYLELDAKTAEAMTDDQINQLYKDSMIKQLGLDADAGAKMSLEELEAQFAPAGDENEAADLDEAAAGGN